MGRPAARASVATPKPATAPRRQRRPILFGLIHLLLIYAMGYLLALTALPSATLIYLGLSYGGVGWAVAAAYLSVPIGIIWFCVY